MSYTPMVANRKLQRRITISELVSQLSEGKVSCKELVEQALERADQCSFLNAFITLDAKGALAAAQRCDELLAKNITLGPLHGIPIVVKDNIHVAGLRNTAGTAGLREFIPTEDASTVRRLKDAGAIIIGKTNLHELAYGITSNNYAFGAVGNIASSDYFAGGSSGGTAVAVAAGIAPVGLGTDTGGSSRIPAALNGIVGFRPTTGRYPSDGLTRISFTRDTVGPMAQTVSDVTVLDRLLSADPIEIHNVQIKKTRLGVPRNYFYDNLEPDVARETERLLQLLKDAGAELVEVDIDGISSINEKVSMPIVLHETSLLLDVYLQTFDISLSTDELIENIASPDVKEVVEAALNGDIAEEVYHDAINNYRPKLKKLYCDYFSQHSLDALIYPTVPLVARPIDGSLETVDLNNQQHLTFPTYIRNTDPGSNAGIPGLTLPLALSKYGLPIGVEIDGPEGSDQYLLALGEAIESLINQQNEI